ncbi:hypothetical protein [Sorangium sp. So ce362]|uniref:hypothetical protein n=1 Tax=Sorangium sp. So ce362 TaxID=3133303 RepID=UPI003F6476B0
MLHPKAYVADCMRLFGEILDHDGGFGGTCEEEPVLQAMFVRTAASGRRSSASRTWDPSSRASGTA